MSCLKPGFIFNRVLLTGTVALWLFAAAGCQPRIYRFTVTPLTIGPDDSIRTNWKVRGAATLLIHDRKLSGTDSGALLRELTLVVQKKGKETRQIVQVAVLPDGAKERIVFTTVLQGDTLVASGINNTARWGDSFVIHTVANAANRPLLIRHAGRVVVIGPGTEADMTFADTPVKGEWEIRSPLTPAEKTNHRLAPDRLAIQITVQHN